MRCWRGYLSGVRCKWLAYGPADATAIPSFLLQKNPEWFILIVPAYLGLTGKKAIKRLLLLCVFYIIGCEAYWCMFCAVVLGLIFQYKAWLGRPSLKLPIFVLSRSLNLCLSDYQSVNQTNPGNWFALSCDLFWVIVGMRNGIWPKLLQCHGNCPTFMWTCSKGQWTAS